MADDLSESLERNIPLFEMIETLRRELAASMNASAGEALRFRVKEVELELRIQVGRERSGKFGFWVVGVGGKGKQTQEDVHVFKLTLKPEAGEGRELLVSQSVAARPDQPSRSSEQSSMPERPRGSGEH